MLIPYFYKVDFMFCRVREKEMRRYCHPTHFVCHPMHFVCYFFIGFSFAIAELTLTQGFRKKVAYMVTLLGFNSIIYPHAPKTISNVLFSSLSRVFAIAEVTQGEPT